MPNPPREKGEDGILNMAIMLGGVLGWEQNIFTKADQHNIRITLGLFNINSIRRTEYEFRNR
jgi:hypothetical protein